MCIFQAGCWIEISISQTNQKTATAFQDSIFHQGKNSLTWKENWIENPAEKKSTLFRRKQKNNYWWEIFLTNYVYYKFCVAIFYISNKQSYLRIFVWIKYGLFTIKVKIYMQVTRHRSESKNSSSLK